MTINRDTGRQVTETGVELDNEKLERVTLYKQGTDPATKKQSKSWMAGYTFGKAAKNAN